MRKKLIAGNWKMNLTPSEAAALIDATLPLISEASCGVAMCVPAVDLPAAHDRLRGSRVTLGAQNIHWADKGAYTGELSAAMVQSVGAACVIIGHSERRQYFAETDAAVGMKTRAALAAGLLPIVCVGELKEERLSGQTSEVVTRQTLAALDGLTPDQVSSLVIAYEPVWAIGTGLVASDEQANETIGVIRGVVRNKFPTAADSVRILYGGSMNAQNAPGLLAQPEIDGGLIGGASLKPADFAAIVNAASQPLAAGS
ncbi:MAG: triose-phosphate isomerase [Oscillospiraceae bacterium]|nr:triose-phosphate isomerase [Oscillospiraceae bacterium]